MGVTTLIVSVKIFKKNRNGGLLQVLLLYYLPPDFLFLQHHQQAMRTQKGQGGNLCGPLCGLFSEIRVIWVHRVTPEYKSTLGISKTYNKTGDMSTYSFCLSRRQQGFKSPWGRQFFQPLTGFFFFDLESISHLLATLFWEMSFKEGFSSFNFPMYR